MLQQLLHTQDVTIYGSTAVTGRSYPPCLVFKHILFKYRYFSKHDIMKKILFFY